MHFASAAEQQAFNARVMAALTSQRSEAVATPADAASAPAGDVRLHTGEDGMNKDTIWCRFCSTKILTPGTASLSSDRPISLHMLGAGKEDSRREELREYWLVSSQMAFENVGVTRGVDPAFRYLTCANCDRGPIGINYFAEPNKFFVAHARVRYAV